MNQQALKAKFTATYEAQSDAIFRFCFMRVSNREQAMDLTQEAFMRFWQTLEKGEDILNHRAYLYTVAQRLIIDWYRKKKALSLDAMTAGEDGEEGFEPMDTVAYENSGTGIEGRFLVDKINSLSPAYRQAVYLRFVEGMSPPEIGEVLGLSANVASVRVNRGLNELRKLTGYDKNQDE